MLFDMNQGAIVMKKTYQERMRELREDRDLKQKEIAAMLGITQQTYALYESGGRPLPIKHLFSLIKYYDVSADYLLGLND